MILQIELEPELEERLRRLAGEARKDVAVFVHGIIVRSVAQREARSGRGPITLKRRLAALREWAASHKPVDHFVDDSRESIYKGCGE